MVAYWQSEEVEEESQRMQSIRHICLQLEEVADEGIPANNYEVASESGGMSTLQHDGNYGVGSSIPNIAAHRYSYL